MSSIDQQIFCMISKKEVGARIKALRLENSLSQEEFGKPVGITRSGLSQIESGSTYPSLELLNKIVKHYNTTWDTIMEGNLMGNPSKNLKGNPSPNSKDQKYNSPKFSGSYMSAEEPVAEYQTMQTRITELENEVKTLLKALRELGAGIGPKKRA